MTPRERVIQVLNHKQTDFMPYSISFTPGAWENMVKYTGDEHFNRDWIPHMHTVMYSAWPTEMPDKKGYFKDEFGAVRNRSMDEREWGVIEDSIYDFEDNHYVFPPLDEKRWRGDIERMLETRGDSFTFVSMGCSLYERSWTLAGMTNVLMAMIQYPTQLHELYDKICNRNLCVIEIALEYDIDGFYFGDDWGSQRGLIMGADHWRTYLKPRVKRYYELVNKSGKFVLAHSCGNIEAILGDFIEIGGNCYETFQPELYDIAKIKKEYGKDMSFWGGISIQQILAHGTPEQVKDETIRTLRIMGEGGGYIAAPTHGITRDIPPANVLAMAEVFTNQSKYI